MRKSDNYAGNQVRLFLGDLKNGSHQSKIKSIEKLQNYIKTYQPNISDDNVDYLYTGCLDGSNSTGFLEWCGADSEKHDGQLKRICAPLIGFLKWLITFPDDTIFYERFVRLSQEDLNKVNFPKHISSSSEHRFNIPGQSRSGSWLDAFELLCILINEHRNVEDEIEPIDLNYLLRGNKQCQLRFEEWLQKSNVEHISDTLTLLRNSTVTGTGLEKELKRPRTWGEVNLKCVPLQEGEDDGNADVESESDELPPIPDPLEVSGMDLRKTQELYSSGQLHKSAMRTRRNTAALLAYDVSSGVVISSKSSNRDSALAENDEEDDDDDDDEIDRRTIGPEKRTIPSVVPSDKSFSASLFLSLVHGNTNFEELQKGLENLKQHLMQQSKRRENLVRTHFGLFVQCSDGLEWLKSYRKGVMKALDVPKVRSYRRSLIDESQRARSNSIALETSVNDKGMDKLKKAQKTLDIAKSEAKSTLAPILERMKHSREIKSAEKVLKGMSSLLDHPHGMKKAMERNELKEVVSIYQRVKNIPSTASLRIVPKIKVAADTVLLDLKKQCFSMLLSPNKNFPELLRYSQLIMELEGSNAYLDILRQTFLRQLIYFVECLLEVYQKFCVDSIDAYDKGQELNIVLMNSHIASIENDSFVSIVKKFAGQTTKRSRSHSVRRPSASPAQISKNISRDSFSSEGIVADDSRTEVLSEGGNFDEGSSFYESDDEFLSEHNYIERMRGGGYSFKDIIDKAQQDGIESLTTNKDYSELLCNLVRKTFSENIIEILSQWFSCLFRLACEIMSQQISIGKSSVTVAPNAFKAAATTGNTNANNKQQMRNNSSSNRLLAQAIGLGTDMLQQVIQGIGQNFRKFSISSELIYSIQELDQYVIAAEKTYGCSLPRGYLNLLTANIESTGRFPDLLMLPVFQNQIKNFFYHGCLTQAFVLFDGMECSMKTVLQSLQENSEGNKLMSDSAGNSSAQKLFSDQVSLGRSTNRVISLTKNAAREVYELEYSSPTSPYYDCMQTLQLLSQEGEIAVCQKLMESLVDRVFDLIDMLFNDSDGELPFVSVDTKSSVEYAIKQIEDLIFKGVSILKRHTRRPEWIAATVYEKFFQKLMISVLERLRRKAMAINESRNGFSVMSENSFSNPSQSSSRRHQRKQHPSTRASMHQNQLILQSLEEELRNMDIGWERDSGDSTFQNKPSAWVDFLRGCIRFRSQSAPKILKELTKIFPLDVILTVQVSNFTPKTVQPIKAAAVPAAIVSSGPSLLNRLFSFDGAPELQVNDSKGLEYTKNVPADSSLSSDNKGGNLYDRILKYVSENGSVSEELSSKIGNQFIKPFFEDLVRIETTATEKYLQYRINGIKTILSSSYTLLLHQDMKGLGNFLGTSEMLYILPNHITRIILALNEERNLLNERLALFNVESGCLLDSVSFQGEERKRFWGEFDINAKTNQDTGNDYGKNGNDQKYYNYLYQELCQGVLKSYQDLLTKLLSNQSLTSFSSGKLYDGLPKGNKVELPYRTLNQAFEEYEFFKIVLRPNFLDTQFLQKQLFSSTELSAFTKEKSRIQRDELLKCGQLLAVMIQ